MNAHGLSHKERDMHYMYEYYSRYKGQDLIMDLLVNASSFHTFQSNQILSPAEYRKFRNSVGPALTESQRTMLLTLHRLGVRPHVKRV